MKRFIILLLVLSVTAAKAQIPNSLTAADKVYGLSKFWQEANYNFVYLDKVDRPKWDSMYKTMITAVQQTANDYQYYRLLQKFCAALKDGHTNVFFPQAIDQQLLNTMFGDYRLFLENIGGKAIVVRTNLSKKDEIPFGSEVIEVNGMPTQQYINEHVAPYIASSTDYVLEDRSISTLLQGLEGDVFRIKLKSPKGDIIPLTLTHKRSQETEVYPAFDPPRNLLDVKWYENDRVAYVSLNSFGDPKIDTLFIEKLPELYKAKGLIIDLRYNGGGSTDIGRQILKYLTNDSVLYGSRSISRFHIPTYKAWGRFATAKDTLTSEWNKKNYLAFKDRLYHNFNYDADTVHLSAKRIVVPTVLLIGHNTASAAEDFLIYADNQKHMTKIGSNSFGSTGQPYLFDMPGGGVARICTKKDTYPDGREFVGYGVKADIEVKPTLSDYLQNKDVVLERSLEFLKSRIK
jgi:C-terminal processing protease CtpA/Prc